MVEGQVVFAIAVFLITYGVIVSDKIHRTTISFCGAVAVVIAGVLAPKAAIEVIDFNTIGLLTGMMVIVGITRETGLFEYLAVKAARQSGGEPVKIMVALSLVTAVVSAFLDNVTTVLLIVPVTFAITRQLQINPLPFLISEIFASNIGGTATLIGDPPNIMIGSAAGLGFLDFVFNLTPVIAIVFIVTVFLFKLIYRKQLVCAPELKQNIILMNELAELKNIPLLKKCLFILGLVILGFVVHQFLHLEVSVIALGGAALLLLITRFEPERALAAVEWPVIFFFIGLFVIIGGLEKVGVIEAVAVYALEVTKGMLIPTGMVILWLSAIVSAFVDNIPFVATMIPLIHDMGLLGGITHLNFLWWALSLGACLGGNGTIIGASANVVVMGMAERKGIILAFMDYLKIAFPVMLVSIIVSMLYLLGWYFLKF